MIRFTRVSRGILSLDSLDLGPGLISVIGPNGSGKTTFLKVCAGITRPGSGSVEIDGKDPRKTDIGWVNEFPDRNFLFDGVSDEVSSGLRFAHLTPDEIKRRTRDTLKSLELLHLATRSVQELSGGEKVLIALAAAIAPNPSVLVLDECDSHLDARSIQSVGRIIHALTIPYIIGSTQDMETAA
ncbi:MAG: ATP-binding cassette domain-containing protein, partial [Methanomicrobiales archaeon]|nr:ATP-binding cassette domain-containing protein [Methanomicrobiales archaeon]